MPTKRQPSQKRRKAEWHRVVENFSRLSKRRACLVIRLRHSMAKRLASEMLAAQEKTNEAFGRWLKLRPKSTTTISSAAKHQAAGSSVQVYCRAMGRTIRAVVSPSSEVVHQRSESLHPGSGRAGGREKRTLSMDVELDLIGSGGIQEIREDKRAIEIYCLQEGEARLRSATADRLNLARAPHREFAEARATRF